MKLEVQSVGAQHPVPRRVGGPAHQARVRDGAVQLDEDDPAMPKLRSSSRTRRSAAGGRTSRHALELTVGRPLGQLQGRHPTTRRRIRDSGRPPRRTVANDAIVIDGCPATAAGGVRVVPTFPRELNTHFAISGAKAIVDPPGDGTELKASKAVTVERDMRRGLQVNVRSVAEFHLNDSPAPFESCGR